MSGSHESPDRDGPAATYFPLVLLLCALVVGVALDRYWPLAPHICLAAAAASLAIWLALVLANCPRAASAALLVAVGCGGAARHHCHWRQFPADEVSRLVTEDVQPLAVEAVALTSPRWVPAPPADPLRTMPQGEQTELLVWVERVRDGRTWRPASGYAEVAVEGDVHTVRAGDRLRIMAHAARPRTPLNPGEFDFAAHLRAERIGCRLLAEFPQSVERLSAGSGWWPRLWLSETRFRGTRLLRSLIAPSRAPLASAILLGAREQLDTHRNENFLVTGTVHVLSVSGLHVGILAMGLMGVFRSGLLARRPALVLVMLLTIAYAMLTDMQPPVLRAAVLVIAMCLARLAHRPALGFNTLAAAAIVVLLWNPASLFQAGAQLSFLAVATLIAAQRLVAGPPITDPLDRLIAATRPWPVRLWRWARDLVWRLWLMGALIWLVAAPLVWKQYHLFSPSALVLNVLLWPLIAFALYSGFAVLLLGGIAPPLARLAARICDGSLSWMDHVIAFGRELPLSYGWFPAPPAWWIGVFYIGLTVATIFPRLRPAPWRCGLLLTMWIAGSLLLIWPKNQSLDRHESPLACHFVSVGHGVSVLVELPDGRNLLYDAGRLGTPGSAVRPISAVLWSRNIGHLDAVVISHADADHFNAIPQLLERFSVGVLYVSPVMFEDRQPAVDRLREAIEQSGVRVREVYGGQRLTAGWDTTIDVLHPPRRGVLGSDNANSIVLLIEHAGRRVLLTGDLESPGLDDVLAEEPIDCDAVLAPHHGSPRSAPGEFADWSTPEHVIISGGQGLGDRPTIERVKDTFRLRGAEVYHTAEDGCVRIEISSRGIASTTFRPHVRAVPAVYQRQ